MAEQLKPQLMRLMLIPGPKWLNRPVANEVVVHHETKHSRANVTCKMLNLNSREDMQAGTKAVINPHRVMGNLDMTSLSHSQQQKALLQEGFQLLANAGFGAPLKHRVQLL